MDDQGLVKALNLVSIAEQELLTLFFFWCSYCSIFNFLYSRSLFVRLSSFFWLLYCLSFFVLWILIISWDSNISFHSTQCVMYQRWFIIRAIPEKNVFREGIRGQLNNNLMHCGYNFATKTCMVESVIVYIFVPRGVSWPSANHELMQKSWRSTSTTFSYYWNGWI